MSLTWLQYTLIFIVSVILVISGYTLAQAVFGSYTYSKATTSSESPATTTPVREESSPPPVELSWPLALDREEYNQRLLQLANYQSPAPIVTTGTTTNEAGEMVTITSTTTAPSPLSYTDESNVTVAGELWPAEAAYPNGGAVLPFQRIVAYYGNFYSTRMGILGEFEPDVVIEKLMEEKANWEAADPNTPVLPAIEHIAMVAQADPGADGMYRAMMPDEHIQKAHDMAKQIDGVLILDIQVGLSPLSVELPKFKKWLEEPDVFFALDPEFSMKTGDAPGDVIGSFNAEDINYTIDYMSQIVRDNELPPKVLLVHRFTQNMVQNAEDIRPTPEVQVVMVMDGWGSKSLKYGTYSHVIEPEPVQFAGIKVFYKNDLKPPSTGLLTPEDILNLDPQPIYIQYQ